VQKGDWVPALASGLFIAAKKGIFTFTSDQLRMVMAVAALALPICNVLVRKEQYDWVWSAHSPTTAEAVPCRVRRPGTRHRG
jgi:hypothetical protein